MEVSSISSFQEKVSEMEKKIKKELEEIEKELGDFKGVLSTLKRGEKTSELLLKRLEVYFTVSNEYRSGKTQPTSEESIERYFDNLSPYYKAKMCALCQSWSLKYSSLSH